MSSRLFFGLEEIGLALTDIVVLRVAIPGTIVAFWRTNRMAGGLFTPHPACVTFAAALNFEIWRLN